MVLFVFCKVSVYCVVCLSLSAAKHSLSSSQLADEIEASSHLSSDQDLPDGASGKTREEGRKKERRV